MILKQNIIIEGKDPITLEVQFGAIFFKKLFLSLGRLSKTRLLRENKSLLVWCSRSVSKVKTVSNLGSHFNPQIFKKRIDAAIGDMEGFNVNHRTHFIFIQPEILQMTDISGVMVSMIYNYELKALDLFILLDPQKALCLTKLSNSGGDGKTYHHLISSSKVVVVFRVGVGNIYNVQSILTESLVNFKLSTYEETIPRLSIL